MKALKRWFGALRRLRATLSPTCREMTRNTSEALDHGLPMGRRLGSRMHLLLCPQCRRYRLQLGWLRQKVRSLGPGKSARHLLSPEAKARIKALIKRGFSA